MSIRKDDMGRSFDLMNCPSCNHSEFIVITGAYVEEGHLSYHLICKHCGEFLMQFWDGFKPKERKEDVEG